MFGGVPRHLTGPQGQPAEERVHCGPGGGEIGEVAMSNGAARTGAMAAIRSGPGSRHSRTARRASLP